MTPEERRAQRDAADEATRGAEAMHRARLAYEAEGRLPVAASPPAVNVGCSGWFYSYWRGSFCLAAFPFCSLICEQRRGKVAGILLSPLHPLGLGWDWSVQVLADTSLERPGSSPERALGLLRFVDGSAFPAMAPSPRSMEHFVSAPLDDGHQGLVAT